MRDIMRLLLGDGATDGAADSAEIWDRRGRRARVADSREWCGTSDSDAIDQLAAALGRPGRGGRVKRVVVKRPGPFGLL